MSREDLGKALLTWQDKLGRYQFQRSLTSSEEKKVELDYQIEECHKKIQEITVQLSNWTDLEETRRLAVTNINIRSKLPSGVSTFTGREVELQQLKEHLLNRQDSEASGVVVLSGGGGIGKSALACHFATTYQDKFSGGVVWLSVDGKNVENIASEFVSYCGEKVDSEEDMDAVSMMHEVLAHRQMLVIFDNALEPSIKKLCPRKSQCAVIITTRNRYLDSSLDPPPKKIDIDILSEEDSLLYQKRREAKVLSVLGSIYYKQGKTEEAIQTFKAQLQIDEEIGGDKSIAIVCNRLGKLLQSQGKCEEAQRAFERGIEIVEASQGDKVQLIFILKDLWECHHQQGKVEDAQKIWERMIFLIEGLEDGRTAATIAISLGGTQHRQKKFSEALNFFLIATKFHQYIESDNLLLALRNLSKILWQNKSLEEALPAFLTKSVITKLESHRPSGFEYGDRSFLENNSV